MAERALVVLVDDDESLRESLPELLKELGFAVQTFSSGAEFLASDYIRDAKCVILDVAMPGMSGLDVQRELKRRGQNIPVVFMTGHADENCRSEIIRQGAADCLFKPFTEAALLHAITTALRAG